MTKLFLLAISFVVFLYSVNTLYVQKRVWEDLDGEYEYDDGISQYYIKITKEGDSLCLNYIFAIDNGKYIIDSYIYESGPAAVINSEKLNSCTFSIDVLNFRTDEKYEVHFYKYNDDGLIWEIDTNQYNIIAFFPQYVPFKKLKR